MHHLRNSGWTDKPNNYARVTRLRLNKLERKYGRIISFFRQKPQPRSALGGWRQMHDSPWASVSVSQPTTDPGTVWSDAVLYTTSGDNNNIIQTFPREIRKYRVLFKRGGQLPQFLCSCASRNGSAVGWTLSGLRSFSTAVNCCAYRVPRTAYCDSQVRHLYTVCL